jgi:hypothetical protein
MCDHLHDTTSRHDSAEKLLKFLRFCRICGIEEVVETLEYEPRPVILPDPTPAQRGCRNLAA